MYVQNIFQGKFYTENFYREKNFLCCKHPEEDIFPFSDAVSSPQRRGDTTLEDGASSQSTTESKGGLQLMVKGGGRHADNDG